MKNKQLILDMTCGGRTIWFNKNHPAALYCDIRKENKGFLKDRPNFSVDPDQVMDFRDLQFPDKSFKMVIWDPPHLMNLSKKSWIYKKYGSLDKNTWKSDIEKGFSEAWRVLDDYGSLILKWSSSSEERPTREKKVQDMLKLFPVGPLVGHTTTKKGNTMWFCFLKIPEIP